MNAQTTIYTQDFETENSGYTPSVTEGSVGSFVDIFNRSNPNIGGNSTFIWAVEDTGVTPATITLDQIDITGYSDFTFLIDLLAHHYNDWDNSDEMSITYSIDGGAAQNLLWVRNNGGTFNEAASLDTDFDGVGDCGAGTLPALTTGTSGCTVTSDQFATFSSSTIPLSGNSTLDITISFEGLTATDEGIYLDNIQVQATPLSTNDTTTEVFAPTTQVAASAQTAIDVTTALDGFAVLGFVVEDQASGDALPTEITRMRFVPGSNNTADWSDHIQGITLLDEDLNSYSPTVSISDTEITLDFSTAISIADGTSLEFELGAYLNTSNIIDGSVLQFQIDGTSSGFLADASGSGFVDPFTLGNVTGNNHSIEVDATQLAFLQQPTNVSVNTAIAPAVEVAYTDANSNIDLDYTGAGLFNISLTTSGSFDATATITAEAVNGVATFNNLVFDATATGVILTATDDTSFISGTYDSSSFDVVVMPVAPSSGDLLITEISDASDFNNEFIEIYNTTAQPIDMSTSKLVMQSDGTVWDFDDDISNATIPVNGFLIITRGNNQPDFESEFGSLNAQTVFIQGTSAMFFGTGRSWQLYEGGTANTADGILIDDTVQGVADSSRDFFSFLTDSYENTAVSSANPGVIDNLVYETGAWKFNAKADGSTGSSDVFFLDNFTATENLSIKNGEVSSTSVLDLDGNNLTISGNLTFKSDTSGSGQLADATGSTITGNVTAERFIPKRSDNARAFRFLASPVGNVNIADAWQQQTHITGTGGASNGFDATSTDNPSMFTYDHTLSDQINNNAWVPITSTTQDIQAGKPYRLYVRGDRSVSLSDNDAAANDVTLSATGTLHTGNQTVTISDYVGNYTFIGNPYQAVVDLNNLTYGADVNTNSAYYWDPSLGTAGGFVTVTLSDGSNDVPLPSSSNADEFLRPGQAVFMKNNASGSDFSIEFNEDDKVTSGSQTQVFSVGNMPAFVNMRIYKTDKLNNGFTEEDALGLRFSEEGNNEVDELDATKMGNPGINLATVNANQLFSIENRAVPQTGENIPFLLNNLSTDSYTFTFNVQNFNSDDELFLKDNYTEELIPIQHAHSEIEFTADASIQESVNILRFELVFGNVTLSDNEFTFAEQVQVYPNPVEDIINISIANTLAKENVQIEIYNVVGKQISQTKVNFEENSNYKLNASDLNSGMYFIKINLGSKNHVRKFIKL
ncbi:hypothetical protein GCM10010832_18670 [Psychroflexus planctonicus]|uniref:LTD domain-containing protein n=2 Tax=Psychroflexus planctonicus TaxID=1526575 RepID=A0ABQ1SIK6_9FLAO|nr:hypothetical protein GCM10010832_18670 [Psychroflexus planctonicus]